MDFGPLRVINDDRVAPGEGFGKHGHRDMEIVTYILEGELQHRDSMGNGSVIRAGDVQRMSAGTGVMHSEFNPSADQAVHLLQVWIRPEAERLRARLRAEALHGRRQARAPAAHRRAATARRARSIIHQDARVYAGLFDGAERADYALRRRPARLGARGARRTVGE